MSGLLTNGTPTTALSSLLSLLGHPAVPAETTLDDLLALLAPIYLRKPGSERWSLSSRAREDAFDPLAVQVALSRCGFASAIKPTSSPTPGPRFFDYIVVLGAGIGSMRARIAHLVALWRDGSIRGRSLVFHTGARVLTDTEREALAVDHSTAGVAPATEAALMLILFDALAGAPDTLKRLPLYFVDAPECAGEDGLVRRPTTRSCALAWVRGESTTLRVDGQGPGNASGVASEAAFPPPPPGSVLAISNQPYVLYQYTVLRAVLAEAWLADLSWSLEVVGPAVAGDLPIPSTLDTLCRILYEESRTARTR